METKQDLNRSLTGKEREAERIAIKRNEILKKKLELEQEQLKNQIESLQLDIEAKGKQAEDVADRIAQGKRLVSGAKIIDVFPEAAGQGKQEEKKESEAAGVNRVQ